MSALAHIFWLCVSIFQLLLNHLHTKHAFMQKQTKKVTVKIVKFYFVIFFAKFASLWVPVSRRSVSWVCRTRGNPSALRPPSRNGLSPSASPMQGPLLSIHHSYTLHIGSAPTATPARQAILITPATQPPEDTTMDCIDSALIGFIGRTSHTHPALFIHTKSRAQTWIFTHTFDLRNSVNMHTFA